MRIRLTLDIQRSPKPDPPAEQPAIYDASGAQVERAEPPTRIGFHMDPLDRPAPEYRGDRE